MFEDSGFEVYKSTTTAYISKDLNNEISIPATYRLEVRDATNDIYKLIYDLKEQLEAEKVILAIKLQKIKELARMC